MNWKSDYNLLSCEPNPLIRWIKYNFFTIGEVYRLTTRLMDRGNLCLWKYAWKRCEEKNKPSELSLTLRNISIVIYKNIGLYFLFSTNIRIPYKMNNNKIILGLYKT